MVRWNHTEQREPSVVEIAPNKLCVFLNMSRSRLLTGSEIICLIKKYSEVILSVKQKVL